MHGAVQGQLVSNPDDFGRVILVLLLAALLLADFGGTVLAVRGFGRLSRFGKVLVVAGALYTGLASVTVFVQELSPARDWWGAFVSSAFIVLYGVVVCGVVFVLDASAKRLRRAASLRA